MAGFYKTQLIWLASCYAVEAETTDVAIERAVEYLSDCLTENDGASKISFTGEVVPMDTATGLALQLLILEKKGGAVAQQVAQLKEEIATLIRQA